MENPLSKRILAGEFGEGDTVLVDIEGDEYVFSRQEVAAKATARAVSLLTRVARSGHSHRPNP